MKAPDFLYRRPESLEEALALLGENAGSAQVLAGGQSLMPTLNMRLSSPGMLVDINRIASLRGISETADGIRIGALVRHYEVLESPLIAREVPLLSDAMTNVAHMAVRNRGTTCGSLALADPSAEMPAVAVLLNATIHLQSREGARDLSTRDFFEGLYATLRRDDEMIVGVTFPRAGKGEVFHFAELSRRHGDFAVVGIGVRARKEQGELREVETVIFGSEPKPLLVASDTAIVRHSSDEALGELAQAIASQMEPMGNHQGRPDTKRLQAAALLQRAFADLRGRLADG
jgi:carbon-monoxide dehydrogenase medium subunit